MITIHSLFDERHTLCQSARSGATTMTAPRRILLADDDATVRLGVAELLGEMGVEALHAESGLEALEIVRRYPLNAVLLDLQMPGCSGLEALSVILRVRHDLPCLVYSGSLTAELERVAMESGAFAVLRKPVQPSLLRLQISRALRLPAAGGLN
jgi:CheY-like chemotaxis protein